MRSIVNVEPGLSDNAVVGEANTGLVDPPTRSPNSENNNGSVIVSTIDVTDGVGVVVGVVVTVGDIVGVIVFVGVIVGV